MPQHKCYVILNDDIIPNDDVIPNDGVIPDDDMHHNGVLMLCCECVV